MSLTTFKLHNTLTRRVDWLAVALVVVTFAVYAQTLAPSVLWADEGEFQYSAYALYVPHTTGYPLYIFVAKLFTLLPVGDVAYRVNLMSAFWGAATVALTYLCVKRLAGSWLIAAASALSLAFVWVFWKQSSIAGVRTMHTAFVALITLLAIGLAQRRVSIEAISLALGLSLTHHRMTLLLLPGLAWVIWEARERISWTARRLINNIALVALPQLMYLFVALGKSWRSSSEFWDFVLGTGVESGLFSKPLKVMAAQFTGQVLPSVWNAFTPIGLLVMLLGLALMLLDRRETARRSMAVYLGLGWLVNIAFAGVHLTEDPNKYLAHGFVLQAAALGMGLAAIASWLKGKISRLPLGKHVAWLVLVLPAVLMATNWREADQSGTGWIGPFTLEELASVESNSLVVGDWAFFPAYRYHQVVQGHRRDLALVFDLDHREMEGVEPQIKSGRPVYLRERRLGKRWKGQFSFIPVGRLWRVLPTEPTFSALQRVDESFGDDLKLGEVAAWPAKLAADRLTLLRLEWELAHPIEHDLSVSTRLVDRDGVIWMHQETPLQDSAGVLSTTAWVLGPALPPGDYHWQITVDNQSTGINLGLSDLPPFHIGRSDHPVPLSSLVLDGRPAAQPGLDEWEFVGYASVVRNAQPGALVTASLFWRATRNVTQPAEARFQLRDQRGNIIAEQTVTLPRDARMDDLVESRPGLELPVRLADGRYEYFVFGSNAVSLGQLQVRGRARNYTVPSIAQRRQIQLGDSIELMGYDLGAEQARPGDQIHLKLIWRAKKQVSQSFKVFIHVVDVGGKLLVQKDGVPGNWALPTDTWAAGEVIVDPYVIPIPPEATPGNYRVQVGLYDPTSGQRLLAIEAGSQLTDDSIPLLSITVR